ncbi:unnamed protein product, partial [marine sediment metagenome]
LPSARAWVSRPKNLQNKQLHKERLSAAWGEQEAFDRRRRNC